VQGVAFEKAVRRAFVLCSASASPPFFSEFWLDCAVSGAGEGREGSRDFTSSTTQVEEHKNEYC